MASPKRTASRARFVLQELAVDALLTAAILWVLVLLGEPLAAIITSPLFIVLMAGSLAYIAWKAYRHKPAGADERPEAFTERKPE
jgi:hypothetical protein